MSSMNEDRTGSPRLKGGSLGVAHIVFLVVAAAAPLTALVGASPAAFAFGNGAGLPGAYVLAGLLYLVFAAGFTAMSRYVTETGGFYVYIGLGLGPAAGLAGAFVAILAYQAVQIAVYALFGLFASGALAGFGLALPWWGCALAALALVHLCGRRNIGFSGRVLGICLAGEIAILIALGLAILISGGGPEGLGTAGFRPADVFAPGLGAAMVFVIACYIGFEATAVFTEEAREPARTVPRATYVAIALITLLYAGSSWAIVQFYGAPAVTEAARNDPTNFYFTPARALLGEAPAQAMDLLLIVSLFACALSLHDAISRYFFALGRDGVAWRRLATLHPVHTSPVVAGACQTIVAALIVALFALAGADPFAIVLSWMSALGTIAILAVQILVAFAVVAFFWRDSRQIGLFRRLIAPILAGAGLAACLGLVIANLPLLAGSESAEVRAFPALVVLVGLSGAVLGRLRRPGDSGPRSYAEGRVDSGPFAQ